AASSDQPWLTTSAKSSSWSGVDQVAYAVAANPTFASRTGTLTVTGGGSSAQLTVVQTGLPPCVLTLSQSSQAVPAAGASLQVAVAASCAWTASSDSPWLAIVTGASGSGDGVISYTVSPNASNAARTGHLTITGPGSTVQLTINQAVQ